jgi:uncharacterized protein YgbK (DUF1537 family)
VRRIAAEDVADRARNAYTLVVLDDDPTGTQTVSDVPVVTTTDADDLRWAMNQPGNGFFVLTNTRSVCAAEAAERNVRVLASLPQDERVSIVSRGDSTLRGHYPLETDVLAMQLAQRGRPVDGVVIVPAYVDAGRVTIDSVHFARTADGLVPVGETEFAADATFGYASSDLREWVEEKTLGRVRVDDVARITLDDIRIGGVARVAQILGDLRDGRPTVADAVCDDDLRVLALSAMDAEEAGSTLVFRSGPSYVRARLGQAARPPLRGDAIRRVLDACAGEATGSSSSARTSPRRHVSLTGSLKNAVPRSSCSGGGRGNGRARVARPRTRDDGARNGPHRRAGRLPDESLGIARRISESLVKVVASTLERTRPRWLVAKGGITSSDVATTALGLRRAWARGTLERASFRSGSPRRVRRTACRSSYLPATSVPTSHSSASSPR